MSMHREQSCPECGETTAFTRVATTNVNLGLKVKWRCDDCGFTTVQIGDVVDTATA